MLFEGVKVPTKKRRIALTVDDDLDSLLISLAELQDTPKATLIVDILEQMRPHLVDLNKALKLVKEKKDPSKAINKLLIGQQKQFLDSLEVSDD